MIYQKGREKDELRAKFTKWIEVSLYRSRVNYLKKKDLDRRVIYADKTWDYIPDNVDVEREILEETIFDFKSDILEDAFYKLSDLQKDILIMLFLRDMKPVDIAEKLNCSLPQIYKQKNKALSALRSQIMKGGDDNE
mgnify:CR=1 FL=1